MRAARTTLWLWLVLQLLLGGLPGHHPPVPPGAAPAQQWHEDLVQREHAAFPADPTRAMRPGSPSADDPMVGPSSPDLRPAGRPVLPRAEPLARPGARLVAAYRARAPPLTA